MKIKWLWTVVIYENIHFHSIFSAEWYVSKELSVLIRDLVSSRRFSVHIAKDFISNYTSSLSNDVLNKPQGQKYNCRPK